MARQTHRRQRGADAVSQQYPDTDATHLRQLIRNARDEAARSKPPKAFREIFRVIREAMQKTD